MVGLGGDAFCRERLRAGQSFASGGVSMCLHCPLAASLCLVSRCGGVELELQAGSCGWAGGDCLASSPCFGTAGGFSRP